MEYAQTSEAFANIWLREEESYASHITLGKRNIK